MPKQYKKVKIHSDTHKALLMYCIANHLKMQDVATKIVNDFLIKEATKEELTVIEGGLE